ncbi:PREDICTED: telomere repeats-binding bouquet formation protein 1-like [Priapulus caudatus]|uniref:Telomere repeats-binding bouquet formation protein 1-like n=1 Tax=Priapulus caudatus TaxID=37621 RepID=A0ABM1EKF8_PRICU|nr:PREDICTED: telomere repeats-binding bouquet formation protein 1-like [Priapulus caudatus]
MTLTLAPESTNMCSGKGQMLVRTSGCLQTLISILQRCGLGGSWSLDAARIQFWGAVISAISACLNNPRNEQNQGLCSMVLARVVHLLVVASDRGDERHSLVPALASLTGQCVAGNVHNQEQMCSSGALEELGRVFRRLSQLSCSGRSMQILACIANAIDACVTDYCQGSILVGSLGVVEALVQLLAEPSAETDITHKTKFLLTLAHLVDDNDENRQRAVDAHGVPVIVKCLAETGDPEFSRTAQFLLHTCFSPSGELADNPGSDNTACREAMKQCSELSESDQYWSREVLSRLQNVQHTLDSMNTHDTRATPGGATHDTRATPGATVDRRRCARHRRSFP